ncbi:MAG: C45 family peptidase [Nannocystaceae bacterium]
MPMPIPAPIPIPIPIAVFDQALPAHRGEAHGESWREPIQELAALRTTLALERGSFSGREELWDVARRHLLVLNRMAPPLSAELLGIARGAAVDPEALVILNHFTDLVQLTPTALGRPRSEHAPVARPDPGGGTSLYVCGSEGPILGQTWDLHPSTDPYVRIMRIRTAPHDNEWMCLTLTGCLGMAGMSNKGVAVVANNLSVADARIGLIWPALIRLLLEQPNVASATELIMRTPGPGGHHYMLADGHAFAGIETSGRHQVRTQRSPKSAHLHTNHFFDPKLRRFENVPRASSTYQRMEIASTRLVQTRPNTAHDVLRFLSSREGRPTAAVTRTRLEPATAPSAPARPASTTIAMSLVGGRAVLARGCAQDNPSIRLEIERWRGRTQL